MKQRISLIVAMAENRVIGHNNAIPWHLPRELKTFKAITMGHHIIMGRKTYESINRLLPGRTTVIITRNSNYCVDGAIIVNSFPDAIKACGNDDQIFVIGGADIYRIALPVATRLYLTTVHAAIEGDTFMPGFDLSEWVEVSSESFLTDEKNAYPYTVSVYDKK